MRLHLLSPTLTLTALACLPLALAAEEGATLVVSAPRESLTVPSNASASERLAATPGGSALISADELARGRSATLRDALGATPGVYVQPRFGSEESRLSIRGSGIQRTFHLRGIMLLQDGQPINQADGGGDFQTLDPAVVDRIEVLRGANALEWGSATLGGAIDYVSPSGRSAAPLRLRLEAGSFGFAKAVAAAGFANGDVDGFLALSAYRQDGYRDHSRQENLRASGNAGWRLADGIENRVFLAFSDSDSALPGSLTRQQLESDPQQANAGSVLRDSKRDYPLYRIADSLAFAGDAERLDLGLGWIRKDLFHPLAFGLITQDSVDWTARARFESARPWAGRDNRLVLGLDGSYGRTDAKQYAYAAPSGNAAGTLQSDALQTARNLSFFAEERHEVAPGCWAIVGAQALIARRDFDDRFLSNGDQSDGKTWQAINPKLGVLRQFNGTTTAFANVSRSCEPPTFAEYVQRDTSGSTRPQQDLDAQSAWTVEIGSRGGSGRARWDVTAYYAWLRDEYLSYQVAPGLGQTVNADRTIHAGVEAGLDLVLWRAGQASDGQVVLAQVWNWGRFRFDDDAVYGDAQIPGLPEHTWRGDLRWERGPWYAGPLLEWQQGWPVDFAGSLRASSAFLLGLRAGYRTPQGLSAFVEGRNLLDKTYAATTGIANPTQPAANQALFNPGDGLSVNAGVEWVF